MRHDADARLGTVRIPRSRGAASGLLLVLLGVWGAVIPFVGPYFDFAFTPNTTWTWTSGRFWLEVLPGAATVLGGLILLFSANRVSAILGGWLAAAAGAWFVVGPSLAPLWNPGTIGVPIGGTTRRALEWITFFYGLGAVILFLAAVALGRLSVRGVRDVEAARRRRDRQLAEEAVTAPEVAPTVVQPVAEPTEIHPTETHPITAEQVFPSGVHPSSAHPSSAHPSDIYPSDTERARLGSERSGEGGSGGEYGEAGPDDDQTRLLGKDRKPGPVEHG